MIIFLYGQDSYRIGQKLTEIVSSYKAKNPSGLNFIKLDFTQNSFDDFVRAIKSDSLIPERKLIIIKNIFSAKGGSISGGKSDPNAVLEFLQPKAGPPLAEKSTNLNKSDDVILVIIHFGNPLKSKLFEYLTGEPNQAQNFKPLKDYEIKNWIKKFAGSLNIEFAGDALNYMASNSGNDLWKLDGEIEKIAAYKIKGVVIKSQVEELVIPNAAYNVFELTDALAKKNKKKAILAVDRALDNGEKPVEILGLLAWQVRNLLRFKYALRFPDLNLHPFVLEKLKETARFFSREELVLAISKIIDLDLKIKTGDINEKTALSLLISEL